MLIDMDAEFFQLLDKLGVHTLPSLLDYYESYDATSLTRKIQSIPAFQSITSPMKQVEEGWVVDSESRYFTEDFPFGLRWIVETANKLSVKMKIIPMVYMWGIKETKQR